MPFAPLQLHLARHKCLVELWYFRVMMFHSNQFNRHDNMITWRHFQNERFLWQPIPSSIQCLSRINKPFRWWANFNNIYINLSQACVDFANDHRTLVKLLPALLLQLIQRRWNLLAGPRLQWCIQLQMCFSDFLYVKHTLQLAWLLFVFIVLLFFRLRNPKLIGKRCCYFA